MFHVITNANVMVQDVIQIRNRMMINVNVSVKINWRTKKIRENCKYLKIIVDNSVNEYDEF